jgi:hypothetical protein
VLGELKAVGNVKSHYPRTEGIARTPFHGVTKRANALDGEYLRKAKTTLRSTKWAQPRSTSGRSSTGASWFSGWCSGPSEMPAKTFDVLVQDTATTGARKHWRKMQCKSPTEAFGIIVWKIRKVLGVAMTLAQARLVINRVQWVGPGAVAASDRRKRARANERLRPLARGGVAPEPAPVRDTAAVTILQVGLMAVPELNQ